MISVAPRATSRVASVVLPAPDGPTNATTPPSQATALACTTSNPWSTAARGRTCAKRKRSLRSTATAPASHAASRPSSDTA